MSVYIKLDLNFRVVQRKGRESKCPNCETNLESKEILEFIFSFPSSNILIYTRSSYVSLSRDRLHHNQVIFPVPLSN